MIGSIKGFLSLVQRENPNVVQTHCFLHREVLVSKTIPNELKGHGYQVKHQQKHNKDHILVFFT